MKLIHCKNKLVFINVIDELLYMKSCRLKFRISMQLRSKTLSQLAATLIRLSCFIYALNTKAAGEFPCFYTVLSYSIWEFMNAY